MKHRFFRTTMLEDARQNSKGRSLIKEILFFLLLFFVSQTLVSIPVTIVQMVEIFSSEEVMAALQNAMQTNDYTEYINTVTALALNMSPTALLTQLFGTLLASGMTLVFCRYVDKRSIASLGLTRPGLLREYGLGVLIGVGLISASVGICALFGSVKLEFQGFSVGLWLLFLVGFLIQGMSEELLCRGYMMVSVSRRHSMLLAVLSNSIAFGLLHLFNPGFGLLPLINIVLFGILESVYVLRRGDLWGACAIHSIWNFFQGNVFGINVSGMGVSTSPLRAEIDTASAWLNGGSFGLEGGLAVTLVLAAVTAGIIFLLPTRPEMIAKEPEITIESDYFTTTQ